MSEWVFLYILWYPSCRIPLQNTYHTSPKRFSLRCRRYVKVPYFITASNERFTHGSFCISYFRSVTLFVLLLSSRLLLPPPSFHNLMMPKQKAAWNLRPKLISHPRETDFFPAVICLPHFQTFKQLYTPLLLTPSIEKWTTVYCRRLHHSYFLRDNLVYLLVYDFRPWGMEQFTTIISGPLT